MDLLTTENPKTKKGEKHGIKTFIVYLSPHKRNKYGTNLCKSASKGCAEACLFGSGMGGMIENVQKAREKRTNFFLEDQKGFMEQLAGEIFLAKAKHGAENIAVRLNGTSDIAFEDIPVNGFNNIFEMSPDVQFYDYTKRFSRLKKEQPKNYYLIFSRNEINGNRCKEALELGYNVAIVFDRIPENYHGFEVIDGDEHDIRYMESGGKVIALKYKPLTGKGAKPLNLRAKKNGFVVKAEEVELKVPRPFGQVEKISAVA